MQGELVRLRAITREDLPNYVRWINDPELARYMEFHRPVSLEMEERWYDGMVAAPDDYVLAIETLAGKHIGSVGLHRVHPRYRYAIFGVFIGDKEHWGRGYGSEAVRLMVGYGFEQLNLNRVTLNVYDFNGRAIRAYEKCGFRHEGRMRQAGYKDGRYFDILVMGILRDEYFESCGHGGNRQASSTEGS